MTLIDYLDELPYSLLMTDRQRKPMSPATQAALIRGAKSELESLKAERAEAETECQLSQRMVIELTARIEAKKAELARARKGQW